MKLLGNSTKKINKDENGEYISHFEINEVILICFYIQWLSTRFQNLLYICS